jgi:hypothetical protein
MAGGLLLSGLSHQPAREKGEEKIDYARVDQIFRMYDCIDCHTNGARPDSKLSLTTYEGLMKGGSRGPAIKAGGSSRSLLLKIVTSGNDPHMPPGNSQLKPQYMATLKQWIDEGARNSPYGEALTRYYTAVHDKKWTEALTACDDLEKIQIDGVHTWAVAARNRMPIYAMQKDETGWYKAAKSLVGTEPLNGNVLNDIAWTIVDPKTWLKNMDADLAVNAAELAVKNTRRQSGAVLDTLAWAYFREGNTQKAIDIEKEALKCSDATGDTLKALNESMKAFVG